jgi:DNA-binding FrmR family transcriptional regulator
LLRHHLKHCVTDAVRRGNVDAIRDELCALFAKGMR